MVYVQTISGDVYAVIPKQLRTGMDYGNPWNSTDQNPERAVPFIGLFGSLDPTDGGNAQRFSVSGQWAKTDAGNAWQANVFAVRSALNLWNDFAYFLQNPTFDDHCPGTIRMSKMSPCLWLMVKHSRGLGWRAPVSDRRCMAFRSLRSGFRAPVISQRWRGRSSAWRNTQGCDCKKRQQAWGRS
jgi:hypothetical protein